jgi:protein TonB
MASSAFAPVISRRDHPPRAVRPRQRPPLRAVAWNSVALTPPSHGALGLKKPRSLPPYVAWLGLGAVLLHALGAAYLLTRPPASTAPHAHEVEVSLTPPPPPPPTPPKPEPQRRAPPRAQPQPLPPISAPTIAPTEIAATSEPVVAAPLAAAAPAPEAPLPVSAPIGRAGYLDNPPPRYPPAALRQGWQGTVTLKVRVLASGSVDSVEVQKSSGRKLLDDEAVRTVQSWRFTPSKRGDTPIDGWASVPIEFKVE